MKEEVYVSQYKLYSVPEVASLFNISPDSVRHLIEQGRLGAIYIKKRPRIKHSEIERFLSEATNYNNLKNKELTDESLNDFRNIRKREKSSKPIIDDDAFKKIMMS